MAEETPVTLSATGFTSVIIWCTKLDHNGDKKVNNIPIARSVSSMTSGSEPTAWNVDLGRISYTIAVSGFLYDDSSVSAYQRKEYLRDMFNNSRNVTITWGLGLREQSYTGTITKLNITETPGSVGEEQPSGYEQEKIFEITLSLIIGTDKRSG